MFGVFFMVSQDYIPYTHSTRPPLCDHHSSEHYWATSTFTLMWTFGLALSGSENSTLSSATSTST